jgi:hypothetical protein
MCNTPRKEHPGPLHSGIWQAVSCVSAGKQRGQTLGGTGMMALRASSVLSSLKIVSKACQPLAHSLTDPCRCRVCASHTTTLMSPGHDMGRGFRRIGGIHNPAVFCRVRSLVFLSNTFDTSRADAAADRFAPALRPRQYTTDLSLCRLDEAQPQDLHESHLAVIHSGGCTINTHLEITTISRSTAPAHPRTHPTHESLAPRPGGDAPIASRPSPRARLSKHI